MDAGQSQLNEVYSQRNRLAVAFAKAALAAGWNAGKAQDITADPGWGTVVMVDLPDGTQVSWHMSADDEHLAQSLPLYSRGWDGTFVGREVDWPNRIDVFEG